VFSIPHNWANRCGAGDSPWAPLSTPSLGQVVVPRLFYSRLEVTSF
jgi:hypothetical protein